MSDPSSSDIILERKILEGQTQITALISSNNNGSNEKCCKKPSKESQCKRQKNGDESVAQMGYVNKAKIGTTDCGRTKMSGKKKPPNNQTQNSAKTAKVKEKQSCMKVSSESKTSRSELTNRQPPSGSRYLTRSQKHSEISCNSSSDCDEDTERSSTSEPELLETKSMNLEFYRNKIQSMPNGDFIENILNNWKDDLRKLEQHHGYIQWLFPIRDPGMNSCAQVLQDDEAERIKQDPVLKDRVLRAYKMMLGFYGISLLDDENGTVGPSKLYDSRMNHLNSSFHNNLRITRILKSLGEFGFEHFKNPLVTFLVKEAFEKNTLVNCRRSCRNFWIPSLTDAKEKEALEKFVSDSKEKEGSRRLTRSFRK